MTSPLLELPLYLLLGVASGLVAAMFGSFMQISQSIFTGKHMGREWVKPLVGSGITALVGSYVPQVLFFGWGFKIHTYISFVSRCTRVPRYSDPNPKPFIFEVLDFGCNNGKLLRLQCIFLGLFMCNQGIAVAFVYFLFTAKWVALRGWWNVL